MQSTSSIIRDFNGLSRTFFLQEIIIIGSKIAITLTKLNSTGLLLNIFWGHLKWTVVNSPLFFYLLDDYGTIPSQFLPEFSIIQMKIFYFL